MVYGEWCMVFVLPLPIDYSPLTTFFSLNFFTLSFNATNFSSSSLSLTRKSSILAKWNFDSARFFLRLLMSFCNTTICSRWSLRTDSVFIQCWRMATSSCFCSSMCRERARDMVLALSNPAMGLKFTKTDPATATTSKAAVSPYPIRHIPLWSWCARGESAGETAGEDKTWPDCLWRSSLTLLRASSSLLIDDPFKFLIDIRLVFWRGHDLVCGRFLDDLLHQFLVDHFPLIDKAI